MLALFAAAPAFADLVDVTQGFDNSSAAQGYLCHYPGGASVDSTVYRVYDMASELGGAQSGSVVSVSFYPLVDSFSADATVDVGIYALAVGSPLLDGNLTLLGTDTFTVPASSGGALHTVTFSPAVPFTTDQQLVVAMHQGDEASGSYFFFGVNGAGDEADWFFESALCGLSDPGVIDAASSLIQIVTVDAAPSAGCADACVYHVNGNDYTDTDCDSWLDGQDNCETVANSDQADTDADSQGDACDACPNDDENDADNDGDCGDADNCRYVSNPDQANSGGDAAGDACEVCSDACTYVINGQPETDSDCDTWLDDDDACVNEYDPTNLCGDPQPV
jgi:hypothetical protein